MFFPKLRRQAKWMFVFLALAFGVGFVGFGVGGGGLGIGDILQGNSSSTSGPSVGDAKDKIKKGDRAAYKELADAYRNENKTDDAITADRAVPEGAAQGLRLHEDGRGGLRRKSRQAARRGERDPGLGDREHGRQHVWAVTDVEAGTRGRDRPHRPGAPDRREPEANTELYSGLQGSYTRATQLYRQISAANPKDLLVLQLLANAAYQSRDNQTAVDASRRVIKLAPGTQEARQARQLIQLIKAQAAAQPYWSASPSGRGP